jgi:hypothetical protein
MNYRDLLQDQREPVSNAVETALQAAPAGVIAALTIHEANITGSDVVPSVSRVVEQLLDIPVINLLWDAWHKHRLVEAARARTVERPLARESVDLAEHTVAISHRPTVVATISGREIDLVNLVIDLTLQITTLTLVIQGGRVAGHGPLTACAESQLSIDRPGWGKPHTLLRSPATRVTIPGPWLPPPVDTRLDPAAANGLT